MIFLTRVQVLARPRSLPSEERAQGLAARRDSGDLPMGEGYADAVTHAHSHTHAHTH